MLTDHFHTSFSVLTPSVVSGMASPTYTETASAIPCNVQPISWGRTFFHAQRNCNYNYSVLCDTDVTIPDDAKIVIDGREHFFLGGKKQSYPFFTYQFFVGEYLE